MNKLEAGITFCDHKVYKEPKIIFGSHKVFECEINNMPFNGYIFKKGNEPYFYVVSKTS